MENVCVSETKDDFISKIKANGKTYHVMENCELWSGIWYDAIKSTSEGLPLPMLEKMATVVLPGEYGGPFKPDIEIFNQLNELLSDKGYKLTFSATGAECYGAG